MPNIQKHSRDAIIPSTKQENILVEGLEQLFYSERCLIHAESVAGRVHECAY